MPSLNTGNAILSNAIAVDSSYNVGIGGAASGSFKLQVTGTSNLTGALTGTSATFSGNLTVDTNTLFVDSTNNRVGINQGTPLFSLDVTGTGRFTSSVTSGSNGFNALGAYGFTSYEGAAASGKSINFSLAYFNSIDAIYQSSGNTNDFGIWTNGGTSSQPKLYIKNGGNVGIGTSTINGSTNYRMLRINGTNGGEFTIAANEVDRGYIYASSGDFSVLSLGAVPLILGTNGSERMRITSGGLVSINGTAINGSTFYVNATTDNQAAEFYVNGTSATSCLYVQKSSNDSSTSQVYIRFLYNNATSGGGQINGNGASSAAFGSYSDERLKENITNLPSQLSNILALRPVEFDYIESEGGGHQIGFIAQEMEKIYPDVVGKRDDDMLTVTGWSKTEARLVKAIQELKAEIEELKAIVATK